MTRSEELLAEIKAESAKEEAIASALRTSIKADIVEAVELSASKVLASVCGIFTLCLVASLYWLICEVEMLGSLRCVLASLLSLVLAAIAGEVSSRKK